VSAFDCCEIDARTSQTDDATIDMKPLPPVGQKKPSPSRCATYRAGGDGRSWGEWLRSQNVSAVPRGVPSRF